MKFLRFKIPNSPKKYVTLLVDTGAACSILKHDALIPSQTHLDKNDIILLNGINPNMPISTLGTTEISLSAFSLKLVHKFNVINAAKIQTDFDGLLGNDFFQEQKAILNYADQVVIINGHSIHFNNEIKDDKIIIPPRCEVIAEVNILGNLREGLVEKLNICDNVLIPNTLVTNNNSKARVPILNLNSKEVIINRPSLQIIGFLPEQSIYLNLPMNTNRNQFEKGKNQRNKILEENLRLNHLNEEEKTSILKICRKYSNLFYLPGDSLNSTPTMKHEIPTSTNNPISSKIYRLPKIHEKEANSQIQKMLDQNIIRPSKSPWNSPIWIVPKKKDASGQQKWRLVCDFRKLNEITIGDSYPLPNIENILDQLGNAFYFSTLDLASGFYQVELEEKDKFKTAIATPSGLYEFNRMPMGLKNSPSRLARLMNIVLSGLQGTKCFCYIDDIVVYGSSLEDHNSKLEEVFHQLQIHNLQLQPDKCEFLCREITYLGHHVSEAGVKPDPNKIEVIKNIQVPKNSKQLKSFLGLIGYYRKFIENFSAIAKPLHNLLKKNQKFEWTEECQRSFKKFLEILTSEPILKFPNFSETFILTTDASNDAIGAVLSQGPIGKDLPISYYSKTLTKCEKNYSTTEKELLAIVESCKHYRPYLYGQKFIICTDHKPLVWLKNCKEPSSRLLRWRLKLMDYDYEILYKKGKLNQNADALSRLIQENTEEKSFDNFLNKFESKNIKNSSNILEKPGDLFEAPSNHSLVHCVSKDFQMSSGIALKFRDKFGQIDKLKSQNKSVGQVAYITHQNRRIYYLITKALFFEKPKYETVFETLMNLKILCEQNNESHLAFPRIACGLDQLHWPKILDMIKYVFHDSEINITIFRLPDKQKQRMVYSINEEELTFEYFKGFHQREVRIPKPKIVNTPIPSVKTLIIPMSCDYSISNEFLDYMKTYFPDLPENPVVSDIVAKKTNQQSVFILFLKECYDQSVTYEDLFATLSNLRTILKFNNIVKFSIPNIALAKNNTIIREDTFFSLLYFLFRDFDYEILSNERITVSDENLIKKILYENHDSPLAGHQGFERTYEKIKQLYSWNNMKDHIRKYIRKCKICQKSKTDFKHNKSPMIITTTSFKFCEQIALDIVGPLPITKSNNRFILTIQDDLTKFIQAYALNIHDAQTVAIHFLKFCTQFGFPNSILTDQGVEFTSKVFKEINKLMSIKHKQSSPYHPQTQGSLERTHLTLKDYFKCYINKDLNNWDEFLNFATFSYNTSIHKSTQKTPYELVFGQRARIPSQINNPKPLANYSELADDIVNKLKILRETARENIMKSKTRSKEYFDKTHNRTYRFNEGDLVLLYDCQSKAKNKKLAPNYKGPYKIEQIHNNHTATLRISPSKLKTYHFNKLKPYVVADDDENNCSPPVIHIPSPSPGTSIRY